MSELQNEDLPFLYKMVKSMNHQVECSLAYLTIRVFHMFVILIILSEISEYFSTTVYKKK